MHPQKYLNSEAPTEPTISDGEKADRLEALGIAIAEKRKEAVDARRNSGIEDIWLYCEEAYLGIDDANRAEFSAAKWAKPTSMQGPVTTNQTRKTDARSTAFVRLTSRYVDAASAKLSEIILPIDDKAFSLKPSPMQDPLPGMQLALQVQSVQPQGQSMQPGQPGQQPPSADDQAAVAAKKAETRIYDWMVEANYPAEARKVIKDAARIGTGVLKAPFPEQQRSKSIKKLNGAIAIEMLEKIVPGMKWRDPWDIFPADGCGENIHDGDYILERDYLSPKNLKKLKGQPGYMDDQIDKVLEEGPGKVYIEDKADKKSSNRYEVWYFYGGISKSDLSLTNAVGKESVKEDTIPAIITLVNDTVIRAIINPNEDGAFPYLVVPWSRRAGHWAGVGVAEQISMPQRMVNAATRALLNNAGLSSGVQIILDQLGVIPADGSWTLTPNKIWYKTAESTASNVRDAFVAVLIPNVQQEMMATIMYGMKLAEEASGIPLVTQGQDGATTPQTFGQAELQNNNAHAWLRNVGASYDDCITEPLVKALYDWLLQDPDIPDDEKGDFQVDAKGSTAMVERAIQEQVMMGLLQAAANPAFQLDPAKLMQEYLRSKRIDPRSVKLTDEQIKAMQQQPQQPPLPIMVEQVKQQGAQALANLEAQNDAKLLQMKLQGEMQQAAQQAQQEQQMLQQGGTTPHQAQALARLEVAKIQANSRLNEASMRVNAELAYAEKEREISQDNASARLQELQLKKDLAMLEYANKHQISLEQLKADLAKTQMQEETKRQLAQAEIALNQSEASKDRLHDMQKHAMGIESDHSIKRADLVAAQQPIEPAGRAEPGQAFSQ